MSLKLTAKENGYYCSSECPESNMKTIQQKTIEIREACIEANPEIVKLKLGCEVVRYNCSFILLSIVSDANDMHSMKYVNKETGQLHEVLETKRGVELFKIIGRDIRLADVLLAEKETLKYTYEPEGMKTWDDNCLNIVISWNLKDDNLDHQTKETIDFIHPLVVTK